MLTMFLSAICALSVNASAVEAQSDTLERYVINGVQVAKFDGSQLVGKTVSDYKVAVAATNAAGQVVRVHLICTDGQKVKDIKGATATEGVKVGDDKTEFTVNGKKFTNASVSVISTTAVYIIDGKVCDKEALNRIKPESIVSMTVNKPGSKEAVKLSGKDNVTVIEVVTKK